jgi:hypothetical protein
MNNSNPWAKVFKAMSVGGGPEFNVGGGPEFNVGNGPGFEGASKFLRSPSAPSPSINSPTVGYRPAASPGLRELPLAGMPQLPFTGIPQLPQLPGPDPVGSEGGPRVQLGGFGLAQGHQGSAPSYGMLGQLMRLFGGRG